MDSSVFSKSAQEVSFRTLTQKSKIRSDGRGLREHRGFTLKRGMYSQGESSSRVYGSSQVEFSRGFFLALAFAWLSPRLHQLSHLHSPRILLDFVSFFASLCLVFTSPLPRMLSPRFCLDFAPLISRFCLARFSFVSHLPRIRVAFAIAFVSLSPRFCLTFSSHSSHILLACFHLTFASLLSRLRLACIRSPSSIIRHACIHLAFATAFVSHVFASLTPHLHLAFAFTLHSR